MCLLIKNNSNINNVLGTTRFQGMNFPHSKRMLYVSQNQPSIILTQITKEITDASKSWLNNKTEYNLEI